MKGFYALDERQKIRLTGCSTCSSSEPYLRTLCRDQGEDETTLYSEDFDFINGKEFVEKGEYVHVRILWRRLMVYSHHTTRK